MMKQEKLKKFWTKNVKATKWSRAFKGYASTYNVEILNYFNPELQLKDTESPIKNNLIDLLTELKGVKLVTTLVLEFKNVDSNDKTLSYTFYSSSKAEKIINESDIDHLLQSIYSTIISNIQKFSRARFRLDHWLSHKS